MIRRLVLACALAGCGDNAREELPWGIGLATFDAAGLGLADATPAPAWFGALADRALLATPTYDGSNQATHPDIVVEPDRALLAITPYPFSRDHFENPSLLVAADGLDFEPYPGAPAPLVEPPPIDHNDDPDLRRDPATGEYELLYLDTERPDRQTLVALRSRDLATWTRRDALAWDLAAGDEFVVSPAAIVDDAGATHLFWVNTVTNAIETTVSADGATWDKRAVAPIALANPAGITPWHVDVLRAGAGFALLVSGYGADGFDHQDVFLATSPDLAAWMLAPAPLLDHRALGLSTLYRSTGFVAGGRLAVWYAMQYYP